MKMGSGQNEKKKHWFTGDQLWLCGLIPHSALVGVREYDGKVKKIAI
jgi:hypothetical protein